MAEPSVQGRIHSVFWQDTPSAHRVSGTKYSPKGVARVRHQLKGGSSQRLVN